MVWESFDGQHKMAPILYYSDAGAAGPIQHLASSPGSVRVRRSLAPVLSFMSHEPASTLRYLGVPPRLRPGPLQVPRDGGTSVHEAALPRGLSPKREGPDGPGPPGHPR